MNNMRKRSNNNNQRRHGGGGHSGGQRRYSNNSGGGGGNRGGSNDGQNLTRQKHHATQMREKYMNHARDAQGNGDRVDVEYYLQHVDHYNRVLTDITAIENERHEKMREQQQANQPQGGEGQQQAQGNDQNQGGGNDQNNQGGNDDQGNHGGNMEEPINNSGNQPRMTRSPRHNNQPRQNQNDPNGAKAANANNEEIPLPGGVIGAV